MTEADTARRVRADRELAEGSNIGIATLCEECHGVLPREKELRAWVPRYCKCVSTAPISRDDDYAAHGLTYEGAGAGYTPNGRIRD